MSTSTKKMSSCCSGGSCGPAKVKPAAATAAAAAPSAFDASSVQQSVEEYYGKVLSTSKDLKTSACTASAAPPKVIRDAISKIPSEVLEKFYGCGSPIPTGIDGLTVLDLGSGSGRDSYVAAALVGEEGQVIGLDMTDEQLQVARKHADDYCTKTLKYSKPNLKFVKGYIENIREAGISDNSIDLAISNCVINLSPAKDKVIKGIYDALAPGGELYFSDVYCDRRLSDDLRAHKVLWGECISGALYIEDFKRICHDVGFKDVRLCEMSPIRVEDSELRALLGEAKFFSITFRCFKLSSLETLCEDYGQAARYLGTIPGEEHSFSLDEGHKFEKGKWIQVCGNTASMLQETRFAKHFQVIGDRKTHYGLFGASYESRFDESSLEEPACGTCC